MSMLSQFCCCCSLETGVILISLIDFFWCLTNYNGGKPFWSILSSTIFNVPVVSIDFSWYYAIGTIAAVMALLSTFVKKRGLMVPLILFEILSIIPWILTFIELNARSSEILSNPTRVVKFLLGAAICLGLQIYAILVEISYYKQQVMTRMNGLIISASPSAPCAIEISPEQRQFISSPPNIALEYRIQDPYAQPYSYHPCMAPKPQVYPQPSIMPMSNVDDNSQAQLNILPFPHGAPPPYPNVLSQMPNEKPPPYAP